MTPEPLLTATGISVEIDGATLLEPVSLSIAPGECIAVLGPNGAGKTTLLRVLSGRLRPSSGSVLLGGSTLDERRAEARREISALIEPPALYPDLTLADHLRFIEAAWSQASAVGLPTGLGAAALAAFGISPLATRFPHELSSGQRQLASLAIAFARPAGLLLLDEPEQRLDPSRRGTVGAAMIAARDRGVAIVFASHDAELVERVADRSVIV